MTDVVLVALITATATLISGPLITFAQGRAQKRERDQESKKEQLHAVQQAIEELFEARAQFRSRVSAIQTDEDMAISSPFAETPELFQDALDTFQRTSRHVLTTLSFHLMNKRMRQIFSLFENHWMEALATMNVSGFYSSEKESEKNYSAFVNRVDSTDLEDLVTGFAHAAQHILMIRKARPPF